jgi:hypothetical protein
LPYWLLLFYTISDWRFAKKRQDKKEGSRYTLSIKINTKEMKSIIVKLANGVVGSFSCGRKFDITGGSKKEIILSNEEQEQRCYESLIDHVLTENFEKNIVSIIANFNTESMENWEKIEIKVTAGINRGRESFFTITNTERLLDFHLKK